MSCAMLRDTKPMMDLNIIIGGGGGGGGKKNVKGSMSISALALKTKTS